LQVLEGATIPKEIAWLKSYLRKNLFVQFRYNALHIAAAHVESYGYPTFGIVSLDLVGPHLQFNFSHLLQANLLTSLLSNIKAPNIVQALAFAFVESHDEVKS